MRPYTFADAVAEALEAARALVASGHCKGAARKFVVDFATTPATITVCHCAIGALTASCQTVRVDTRVFAGADIYDAAALALRAELPRPWRSVSEYNDAANLADVLRLYQRATATVRAAA